MTNLEKRIHVHGESRSQLAAELKAQYEQGASIRELMKTTGRSYGFIHQVLTETHVPLRRRGRPYPAKSAPAVDSEHHLDAQTHGRTDAHVLRNLPHLE